MGMPKNGYEVNIENYGLGTEEWDSSFPKRALEARYQTLLKDVKIRRYAEYLGEMLHIRGNVYKETFSFSNFCLI